MPTLATLSTGDKAELGILDGPLWVDHCGHPEGAYVASYECHYKSGNGIERPVWRSMPCDLYVYEQDHWPRCGVCIRHSNEPSDYYSVGSVDMLIQCSHHEPHTTAYAILTRLGHFVWQKDQS